MVAIDIENKLNTLNTEFGLWPPYFFTSSVSTCYCILHLTLAQLVECGVGDW